MLAIGQRLKWQFERQCARPYREDATTKAPIYPRPGSIRFHESYAAPSDPDQTRVRLESTLPAHLREHRQDPLAAAYREKAHRSVCSLPLRGETGSTRSPPVVHKLVAKAL